MSPRTHRAFRRALMSLVVVGMLGCGDDEAAPLDAGSKLDAAMLQDAGGAASGSDAASGGADAATDAAFDAASGDDASSDDDGGVSCSSRRCRCELLCDQVALTRCNADPPRAACIASCDMDLAGCEDEYPMWIACVASLPRSAYSCFPTGNYVADGCLPQMDALALCVE